MKDNVGVVPKAPHVMIDVDNHRDRDLRGLKVFEARHPEFFGDTLRHTTGEGLHIQLHCEDAPSDLRKPIVLKYLNCVKVAFYVGEGENIIIPPSVHENRSAYTFAGSKAYAITWDELLKTFGYEGNNGHGTAAGGNATGADPEWKSRYRGDLRTLDICGLADHLGILGRELPNTRDGMQRYTCECPWRDEHTVNKTDEWTERDTSGVLMFKEGSIPAFDCKHSHGAQYRLPQFLSWCEEQEAGIVDNSAPGSGNLAAQVIPRTVRDRNTERKDPPGLTRKSIGPRKQVIKSPCRSGHIQRIQSCMIFTTSRFR